ncbi:MAG: TraR/DksA C4-type zinc finger protein [Verrucomicrobiota bacterium]
MNDSDSWGLREQLLTQRRELLFSMQKHRGIPDEPVGAEDPAFTDQSNITRERVLDNQIAAGQENLLAKIDLALERIEAGSYGSCLNCSRLIDSERLAAKPSVSLCLDCQKAKEAP